MANIAGKRRFFGGIGTSSLAFAREFGEQLNIVGDDSLAPPA
jgi:hypothetical protein